MITRKSVFVVKCDRCSTQFVDGDGNRCFTERQVALESVQDSSLGSSGWRCDDGVILCPKCNEDERIKDGFKYVD